MVLPLSTDIDCRFSFRVEVLSDFPHSQWHVNWWGSMKVLFRQPCCWNFMGTVGARRKGGNYVNLLLMYEILKKITLKKNSSYLRGDPELSGYILGICQSLTPDPQNSSPIPWNSSTSFWWLWLVLNLPPAHASLPVENRHSHSFTLSHLRSSAQLPPQGNHRVRLIMLIILCWLIQLTRAWDSSRNIHRRCSAPETYTGGV